VPTCTAPRSAALRRLPGSVLLLQGVSKDTLEGPQGHLQRTAGPQEGQQGRASALLQIEARCIAVPPRDPCEHATSGPRTPVRGCLPVRSLVFAALIRAVLDVCWCTGLLEGDPEGRRDRQQPQERSGGLRALHWHGKEQTQTAQATSLAPQCSC